MPAASIASIGTVYQHARVDERALREIEVAHLDHGVGRDLFPLVRDHLVAHLDRAEVHHRRRRAARTASSSTIAMSVSVRGWVYSSASSYWLEQRDVVDACRARRRGTAGPGAGTPRPGARPRSTRASSTVPIVRSSSRSMRRYSSDDPLRSPTSRAGERSPAQYIFPPRGFSRSSCTSVAHGVVEPVAEPALVVGRERELVRRARDLRAQHERVLGVDDRALGRAARQLASGARRTTGRAGRRRRRAPPPNAGRCARPGRPAATSTRACPGSR